VKKGSEMAVKMEVMTVDSVEMMVGRKDLRTVVMKGIQMVALWVGRKVY
jgi:hypothetical protein